MSPVVAVVHHDADRLDEITQILRGHGFDVVTWLGFGGAHNFIAKRRPRLILVCAERANHEPAHRLIEELGWDPVTRDIPLILRPEPKYARLPRLGTDDDRAQMLIQVVAAMLEDVSCVDSQTAPSCSDPHALEPSLIA